ncbi:MAG: M4 family metallopeptidase [Lentisphaerae bacterium]|nr:M4 family metallopeptidase [Lentisphaerota bacterium]
MKPIFLVQSLNPWWVIQRIILWGSRPAIVGALLLASTPGVALQPNANSSLIRVAAAPATERARSPDQQRLTAAAVQEGVQVEWNNSLGTPFSIRGTDLGARRVFSAGKGLRAAAQAQPETKAIAVLDNLAGIMGIRDAQQEFAAQPAQADALGFRHVRATQTYQGLKVFGGKVIVHFNQDGTAYQVNGRYVPDISVDVNPQLTPDDALGLALQDLAALGLSGGALIASPELVICAYQTQPRLAYALMLAADPPEANRWRYFVDAQDGSVLLRYNDIKFVDIYGAILSGEGGTTNAVTNCVSAGITNYLRSTNFQWLVYNYSTNSLLYPDISQTAFRTNSFWLPEDRVEMSAAVNFDYVQRYFSTVHARNSYDTNGALAYAYVHVGNNYVNAFWWSGVGFFFGDGDGTTANQLGVLDVAGHEFTHAVTEYSANLVYASEPGALNESFSDIFGAIIEFYYQPVSTNYLYPAKAAGKADWLLGEDCWVSSTALRDMRAPTNSATVGLGSEQPNHYKGPYWYSGSLDNGGVHYNSGVQNYFFYLLSAGGTSEYGGVTTVVNGIGITNAARIAYRTLTTYCYDYTDYSQVRSAWISAAQDLNSAWVPSVTQAWEAVGYGGNTLADLGTALNATYLTWYTGGNSNWFAQTNVTYDGVLAAQSGPIDDDQQSRLQTTFSGAGIFSFWWKVSSEANYDYLRFFIDGQEQKKITSEASWAYYAYTNLSGTRTATWVYTKDSSVSNGYDAGWVDQVAWAASDWAPILPAISATDGDYADRIRISWSAISGATDYLLYRNSVNNSNQAQIIVTNTSATYDDTAVVPGSLYYYWMQARNGAVITPLTAVDSGYRNLQTPTALAASKGTYTDSVRLTWTAAAGATSYQVLRSTSSDSATAAVLVETGATSYNDTTAQPGVTYYYWLTSRKWRPEGILTSSLSSGDSGWRRSMAATDKAFCDFDGDGKADPALYQSATGKWLIMMSSNFYQTTTFQLGGAGYTPVPQDFDGDGLADIAVYASASGQWLALLSAYGYMQGAASLGGSGYTALPRDYDGDGKADPVVLQQASGLWKALLSGQGYSLAQGYFGDAGYTPCPADFDNDGTTDLAIFQVRQTVMGELGYWFAALSASAYATRGWNGGQSGQLPVPQDYDGDGQADAALYAAAAGIWNYWPSATAATMPTSLTIGGSGFVAVAGDYDGDRKADAVVYRETTGTWVALISGSGWASATLSFGGSGYEPAAAFPSQ